MKLKDKAQLKYSWQERGILIIFLAFIYYIFNLEEVICIVIIISIVIKKSINPSFFI